MSATEERFYHFAVERARLRDRLYFASDDTAAKELGVSRRTILRCKRALERQGRMVRCANPCPRFRTACYRFPKRRVALRTTCRRSNTPVSLPYGQRYCRGRRKLLVERHPEKLSEGVLRKSGEVTPFNASDAIAAVCGMYGHPIPRDHKARLGRSAKELLEDGFAPNTVCAAMYAAVRRARPDLVSALALEIQNAHTGQTHTWLEWRQALHNIQPRDTETTLVYSTLKESFR